MNVKHLLGAAMLIGGLAVGAPANAAPLLFDFSGPSGTALFQLDSNPTPDFAQTFIGSDQFGFNNVAGTFGGVPGNASTISFGNGIFSSLSINAANLGFTQFSSPTLFTGSPNTPVFTTGLFTLINPFFGNGTLAISQVATSVPEPASLALFGIGLLGLGAVKRARRRAAPAA